MIDIKAIKAAAEAANKHDELSLDQLVEYLNAVPTEAVIALCDEIERLRTDAARLDWLEHKRCLTRLGRKRNERHRNEADGDD